VSPPDLAVVIPSHRRTDLLAACLASVTRHAPPSTDILVVDDGSPDAAVSRTASTFGVRVLRLPRPGGFCVAANRGIAAVTAPVVELLNDDTEVTPGWADAALARFRAPAVAAVAPLVLRGPPHPGVPRIDSAGDGYDLGGFAYPRGRGRPFRPEDWPAGPVFGASASAAFCRRDLLLRVGAFPEAFGAYFEDVDLSFRLRRAGGEIIFEPASRVWHCGSASYGRRPDRRLLERQSLNEERVFWRNLPGPVLLRSLPRHLAVLAGKALRRWSEGTLTPYLLGRLRLLAELGPLLRHRRELFSDSKGEPGA
jgi:GT2 family glycosyltransferase